MSSKRPGNGDEAAKKGAPDKDRVHSDLDALQQEVEQLKIALSSHAHGTLDDVQLADQPQMAIELLESLGAEAPGEPVFALSLADLYFEGDHWDDLLRVTEGVTTNEDDATLNILAFRAYALNEKGLTDAAVAVTKEALRTKKRNPALLRFARYIRGRAYENAGKAALARKEFEKVYAEDAGFGDVAERLGMPKPMALPPPPET
jgi:tetratricopeptide (TPR) repeat protein